MVPAFAGVPPSKGIHRLESQETDASPRPGKLNSHNRPQIKVFNLMKLPRRFNAVVEHMLKLERRSPKQASVSTR